ncbi:MAG: pilus assembly protein PilE [Burkholderiales bacterium]|nr:pilus assembly protein PilE [Burkholderiales bacterium]MDE2453857.1 pilus assembly protein PilE [Burkholderiales bacterium]
MQRERGFGFVDILAACAIAGVLAGVALPSYQSTLLKSHRSDALAALRRIGAAQERYRGSNGFYAADLATLGLAARSPQGLYAIELQVNGRDRYEAAATPLAAQQSDRACPRIVLEVASGFPTEGPVKGCWTR